MALTLYAATVPSFRQILGSVAGLLEKAQAYCTEHSLAPEQIIQARLASDMLPFAYQVRSTATHSIGAIEGMRRGTFSPDRSAPPETFAALGQLVHSADAALAALDPAELDTLAGREVLFVAGERRLPFTGENFLLSFSQPNFYFHATTAYDILRWKGLQIGKRDYAGQLRMQH
jgi:hypothetical protein